MADRKGIMLCYPFEEKRLNKWGYPVLVQPKLDGERSLNENFNELRSSSQEVIVSVPHINAALKEVRKFEERPMDGELWCEGMVWEEVHSIVSRTVNFHSDFTSMQYHIFDFIQEDVQQWERITALTKLRDRLENDTDLRKIIKVVETKICFSFEEVWQAFEDFIAMGYEGIIVRNMYAPYIKRRSIYVMKFKPKKDDWYYVIGKTEEIDKHGRPKGRLGAVTCTDNGGNQFSVGSGFTVNQREEYWERDLIGWLCHVQYQHITPGKGVPRFPVFLELVDPKKEMGG